MPINILPNRNNDKQDEMKQTMFTKPPPSYYRQGSTSTNPAVQAQSKQPYKNLPDMGVKIAQQGLEGMDKLAGIQQSPERFPNRQFNEAYKSPTLAGTGSDLQLPGAGQQVNAGQILPVQQQQQPVLKQQVRPSPEMGNEPMAPVNLAETATQQPGYVSPEQVTQLKGDTQQLPEMQNYGGQQLPGGQPGQTSFDSDYMNRTYGDNRTTNEERFDRNRADALKQDQASGEMVNRLNRGTQAMRELSDMRNPGAKMGSLPGSGGYVPVSPTGLGKTDRKLQAESERQSMISKVAADKDARETEKNKIAGQQEATKQQFEETKYKQGLDIDSAKFDAKLSNQLGQKIADPDYNRFKQLIANEADPQMKQKYINDFEQWAGFPMNVFDDFIKRQTQPRVDDMGYSNLPTNE